MASDTPISPSGRLPSSNATTPVELYQATLKHVPSSISTLLSAYSGIPANSQKERIAEVRDRAYKSYPYPCLGRWRFLELDLASHPLYHSEILPALAKHTGEEWLFLDLGTCLGQDVRKLIFDGADPLRIYGADLRPEFIDIGYSLFRDEEKFPREHFIAPADVFDRSPESELARKCDGNVGILHSSAVFHLFGLEGQRAVARRCLQLLDLRRKRALLCGAQVGNVNAGEFPGWRGGGTRYRHNEESWREMWEAVAAEEEWKDKIRSVEVRSTLEEVNLEQREEEAAGSTGAGERSNNVQRQIGSVEKGFRWQKWWVWIDFV